jgi:hypothetical protein
MERRRMGRGKMRRRRFWTRFWSRPRRHSRYGLFTSTAAAAAAGSKYIIHILTNTYPLPP